MFKITQIITINLPGLRSGTGKLLVLISLLFTLNFASAKENQRYDLDLIPTQPIGDLTYSFQEPGHALTFTQALQAFENNQFTPSDKKVLAYGVGPSPVWVRLAVKNSTPNETLRKLLIDAPWLDDIQVYIRHNRSNAIQQYHTGDNHPFSTRPFPTRPFYFNAYFLPGDSDIFVRIETPDPMVIPIYLLSNSEAIESASKYHYGYGFGYGFLLALLAYNMMLFLGLKEFRYLLYVIYLGFFTIANFSYTGHSYRWLWQDHMEWQQWSLPLFIILFGMAGLIFALYFLDTKQYALRFHNSVIVLIITTAIILFVMFMGGYQTAAFLLTFFFLTIYLILMLVLGGLGLKHNQPSARYFLLAMISGLIGVAISMFASWGFLPFNPWTFNAAQIGTLIEAILLAFALSYRFRYVEEQKLEAEKMALMDPLTELNNRRSFYQSANNLWGIAKRHKRVMSVIMFDVDSFKSINDEFGHTGGDKVLKEMGKMLSSLTRKGDIAARWGGEEFILLLAESDVKDAVTYAERLRKQISELKVLFDGEIIQFTASFGVAEKTSTELSIDSLIEKADKALHSAKINGKDQVIEYSNVPDLQKRNELPCNT